MSPRQEALLARVLPDPGGFGRGERAMMPALTRWLVGTGRIGQRTLMAEEIPWLGRRVDVALLSARGATTAFELKVGSAQRVLEQTAYNSQSFHRSWMVTPHHPKPETLAWAQELGLGILVVRDQVVQVSCLPRTHSPHITVTRRLRAAIRDRMRDTGHAAL